jgi:nucleoside 2-deoxyribosyltransferase/sugar/nucleoside kinase (ribokinase family)
MTTPPAMATPLLVGEVSVDVTVAPRGAENKVRLGGIAHAARAFWALDQPFAAGVIVPKYLKNAAKSYLSACGCAKFVVLASVSAAPNVTLIFDPTEVDDQGYDTLLRDEKVVEMAAGIGPSQFSDFADALVFPGTYDLASICAQFPTSINLHIDAAYDVPSYNELRAVPQRIATVFMSTSSSLFGRDDFKGMQSITTELQLLNPEAVILKENRGGSRLYVFADSSVTEIPAQLGTTVNSVGVGDVFDATYITYRGRGLVEAAWRATYASSAYAQTTDVVIFQDYARRDSKLSLSQLRDLGGTVLPWEVRQAYDIYLAAPDFKGRENGAIERAVSALRYHNFNVRRPVQENGQLSPGSDLIELRSVYEKDVALLRSCRLVFAIPIGRDPGTLVEVGLGIAAGIPVVVFDPDKECPNTMVMAGGNCYSQDLDACINEVFTILSNIRSAS